MNNNVVMKAKDTLSAKLAECFITIGNNRYNFMQMINFEAQFEKLKQKYQSLVKQEQEINQQAGKEHFQQQCIITNQY